MSQPFSIVDGWGDVCPTVHVGLRWPRYLLRSSRIRNRLADFGSPRISTTSYIISGFFADESALVKEQLEKLVLQMYKSGIQYAEAVREFQKTFIVTVLQEQKGNQVRAARELRMHRNTLSRTIWDLEVDMQPLRASRRRPPVSAPPVAGERKARASQ
jgi:Fis family transcriptional regulator